jgi:hypothetical protein
VDTGRAKIEVFAWNYRVARFGTCEQAMCASLTYLQIRHFTAAGAHNMRLPAYW